MQQFTQKAAPDSYIGHDCLMAVSMVRLLIKKKEKSSDSIQIHPPVLLQNGAEGHPVTASDPSRELIDSVISHCISTRSR